MKYLLFVITFILAAIVACVVFFIKDANHKNQDIQDLMNLKTKISRISIIGNGANIQIDDPDIIASFQNSLTRFSGQDLDFGKLYQITISTNKYKHRGLLYVSEEMCIFYIAHHFMPDGNYYTFSREGEPFISHLRPALEK